MFPDWQHEGVLNTERLRIEYICYSIKHPVCGEDDFYLPLTLTRLEL